MKRTIRFGVYETNSSSVHTLVYRNLNHTFSLPVNKKGIIKVPLMELGKSGGCFTQLEKLSYLMTDLYYLCGGYDVDEIKERCYGYDEILECIKNFAKENGIEVTDIEITHPERAAIDHQSIPYGEIKIVNVYDKEALKNFLFCDDIVIEFDTD